MTTAQTKKKSKIGEISKTTVLIQVILGCFLLFFASLPFWAMPSLAVKINFLNESTTIPILQLIGKEIEAQEVSHVKLPEQVKAIYMTSWVAGTRDFRERLVKIVDTTEINSIIIDIKDCTGKVAFKTDDESLAKYEASENRIPDIKEFLEYLHEKDIYVIGRISVFQDPHLVKMRPDLAVKKTQEGDVWKDHKGISWLDAGATDVWEYVIDLARYSYSVGFDEINFDYIRFPSDGDMSQIYYPFSESRIMADVDMGKAKILREFFSYLDGKLSDLDLVISADLFGMVTTNSDDLNIGQVLEYTLPWFDYVSPMVYPSHYPTGFIGLSNPAANPYEVVKYSMDKAVIKAQEAGVDPLKLRPWLQDFDLGADYNAAEVRAQIKATYDAGLNSWLLWSASNRYTVDALLSD